MTAELLRLSDWLQEEGVTTAAMEANGCSIAGLQRARDDRSRVAGCERSAHQGGARAQDRRQRRGMDSRPSAPRLGACQLHPPGRKGAARAGPLSQDCCRAALALSAAHLAVAGGRQHRFPLDVASDIVGVSGTAMLRALANGESDLDRLVELAKTSLRNKREELRLALEGSFGSHQRFLLGKQLDQLEFIDRQIADLNLEVEQRLRPFEALLARLDAIPGIGQRNVEQILSKSAPATSCFPSAAHFASGAKLCPGNDESAGKRRSGRTGMGSRWLRSTMVEAAWSASRVRNSYFAAQYHRLVPRRGKRRAAVAVAHSMLIATYHLIKDGTIYQDLGPNHFDELDRKRITHRAVRRLQALGYTVTLEEVSSPELVIFGLTPYAAARRLRAWTMILRKAAPGANRRARVRL